jgi:2,3-bisphosphoglycerate-independent phosphoglycerate mutase
MKAICKGRDAGSMAEAIRQAYAEGQEDELLDPIVAVDAEGEAVGPIREGDCVIFYNIRGEREIQLTEALAGKGFTHFPRPFGLPSRMATMIEYEKGLPVQVGFPPLGKIRNTLGEVLDREGIRQARIVETEKAVHLSFFFNGKVNDPLPLEERIFIPSDKDVTNFDERPEMSADQVTSALVEKLREGSCPFVMGNLANVDVVGHLEGEAPVRKAIETVDRCAGRVVEEAGKQGYVTLVTADHGTVEKRLYPDGAIDTGHSDSPVPFVLIPPGGEGRGLRLRQEGSLVDVAPTVLDLFGLPVPEEMTGRSLLDGEGQVAEVRDQCKGGPRVLLLILDGWGHLPGEEGNLIATTPTPVMDGWMDCCPWTRLKASGLAVGMPEGSVGNSECGHLHMGVGRVIPSDRVRIDEDIRTGAFFENEAFRWAMEPACGPEGGTLHLLGIVSFYSSHGSLDHLFALMEMAKRQGARKVCIHSLLGRRGERPESGPIYVDKVEKKAVELGLGEVVTVMGRYWAMDREHNWDRIEKAYKALVGDL